eukprot:CAMPEP_0185263314 /NCGR_PEP_ID=MMETSP1359-20130426/13954_1 /TAXON_ID=552665 /ORGANISM="Bigelowiella longifila, Strain CCMP242" /LENGTH=331 /DNA_ID=CAMNT_0027850749 /DNA_START=113 /DNA_END=1108 /DNA_ORIENTATION=+
MTTFTSPMAIVATVAMVLLMLEANYLLRLSLRRRKQRKLKLNLASIKTPRLSSVKEETDIETPTISKMHTSSKMPTPLPRAPSTTGRKTTGQETIAKEDVAMEHNSKVKLLPLPEYNESNISAKLRAVPIERECSAEQRLGAAILNVFRPQQEQSVIEPIEIINKLRGKTREINAQYGCAVLNGSKVTFVEDLDDALKIAHSTKGTSTRAVLMPSTAEDEQTKSLIGKARKVARRCAECTRPLMSEDANVFVCSSCSKHKGAAAPSASNQDDTDHEWQSVKPRRRRKSEKRTNNKQKRGRNNRKLSPRGKTSSRTSSNSKKMTARAVTRGQ